LIAIRSPIPSTINAHDERIQAHPLTFRALRQARMEALRDTQAPSGFLQFRVAGFRNVLAHDRLGINAWGSTWSVLGKLFQSICQFQSRKSR
jgi:hypothetical protein